MSTPNNFRGAAPSTAQESRVPVSSVTIGHTYVVTITDDNGRAGSVSVVAATTTPADLIAAWLAAWAVSSSAVLARVLASDGGTYLVVQARMAGRPFSIAATDNGFSMSPTTPTPSSSPSDVALAENWSAGVPATGHIVRIPATTPPLLYNLGAIASAALDGFEACANSEGNIGRIEDGELWPLKIKTSAATIRGRAALVALDLQDSAIAPLVEHDGAPPMTQSACVYLAGSALTGAQVRRGIVAVAGHPAQTATLAALTAIGSTAKVIIGEGCAGSPIVEVLGAGAQVDSYAQTSDVFVRDGAYGQRDKTWTGTLTGRGSATIEADYESPDPETPDYGDVDLADSAVVDVSRTPGAKAMGDRTLSGTSRVFDPLQIASFTSNTDNRYLGKDRADSALS